MADGCLFVMQLDEATLAAEMLSYPKPCFVNLGAGIDGTIRALAETVREVVGFDGELEFDHTRPDGTKRKLLDVSRMQGLGWSARTSLREGIGKTYRWFVENRERARR
jgi:GDP-L-fucose synthase